MVVYLMKSIFVAVLISTTLVGCTTLPETLLRKDSEQIKKVDSFALCRAAFDYDITDRRKYNSSLPNELSRRSLDTNSCFDLLLDEHGVDSFCSRYNRMVALGEPDALIGFATNISRANLEQGLRRNNINCRTDDYITNFNSGGSSAEVDGINSFFNSLNEGIKQQENNSSTSQPPYSEPTQSKTTCREYIDGSVRCKTTGGY